MIKHIFISTFLLSFFSFSLKAQQYIQDNYFKYFLGTTQPPSDWTLIDFDDTSWSDGVVSVGYGDNDDMTVIPEVTSVYSRIAFNIDYDTAFKELVFICDFDDGFVAYINGVEIARVNLGDSGTATTYNQLTDRSHEAEYYRRANFLDGADMSVRGFYIDSITLANNLVTGKNILSVEVHNDSINGSDLSMNCKLADITNANSINVFSIQSRYKKDIELDSTLLPIIIIESDEFGILVKRIETQATMGIVDNGPGNYNKPTDFKNHFMGPIEIEVRGQSSASYPKQSFDFETQDYAGNDFKFPLLGLPLESDWVLQGPYADKSQIRNAMIYELACKTGHWAPRIKFCEVIINGEYVGLYNLTEKIKRDTFRIDIKRLRPEEISGNDLTGGYIIKWDKGSNNLQIVYPKEDELQDQQRDYILNFFDEYHNVLASNDGLDTVIGYKKYIDDNSLIDYIIISELGRNCDAYLYSSFMYKDRDDVNDKIKFGPVWDYDLCFGNSQWQDGFLSYGWQFEYPKNNRYRITRLFEDTLLVDKFEARWLELRNSFLHTDSLLAIVDSLTSWLAEPIARNYQVWPVIDKGYFFPAYMVSKYEEEINYMKNFIVERTSWMDENIDEIFYPVTYYSSTEEFASNSAEVDVYPNPFKNEFNIDISLPESGNLRVRLINIQGQVVEVITNVNLSAGDYSIYWPGNNRYLPIGYYLLDVRLDNTLIDQKLLIKSE